MELSKTFLSVLVIVTVVTVGGILSTLSKNDTPIETPETLLTPELLPTSTTNPSESLSSSEKKSMQQVTLQTNLGPIVIELDTVNTPNTAENFKKLASSGFYNGTRFHRVIDGFMIQGGDPQSADLTKKDLWGTGGPGYQFADEIKPTNNNTIGTISMANAGPNTNGSQFFINTANNDFLNPKHTVFGKIVSGMDVVNKISQTPVDGRDRPIADVVITTVTID